MESIEIQVKEVARRIRRERKNRRLSQMELANEAEIAQSFLASIESGKKIPTVTTVLKIARALGISPALFFTEDYKDRELVKEEIINRIWKDL